MFLPSRTYIPVEGIAAYECVCVCVCLCVGEREIYREGNIQSEKWRRKLGEKI